MARLYQEIDEHWRDWIAAQPMFFVGSAPLDADGHVNVSPKGPIGSLRVIDPHTVAYLDVYGSGSETIAHIRENGRIVVMFCAFDGPPRILRLHGRARVVLPDAEDFAELLDRCAFDDPGPAEARRSIVVVDVTRVGDSCGYGVPLMDHRAEREHYPKSAGKALRVSGVEEYTAHRVARNAESIDGLPALDAPAQSS